jgi:Flp pilus assembly protein TadD
MSTPARVEFNVAVILHERGDVAEAIAAYRRAERRGDPDAAFNLGVLLSEAGDLDGAETSWRRSAHYGNARATDDLGFLVRRSRERQTAGTEREGADR